MAVANNLFKADVAEGIAVSILGFSYTIRVKPEAVADNTSPSVLEPSLAAVLTSHRATLRKQVALMARYTLLE